MHHLQWKALIPLAQPVLFTAGISQTPLLCASLTLFLCVFHFPQDTTIQSFAKGFGQRVKMVLPSTRRPSPYLQLQRQRGVGGCQCPAAGGIEPRHCCCQTCPAPPVCTCMSPMRLCCSASGGTADLGMPICAWEYTLAELTAYVPVSKCFPPQI